MAHRNIRTRHQPPPWLRCVATTVVATGECGQPSCLHVAREQHPSRVTLKWARGGLRVRFRMTPLDIQLEVATGLTRIECTLHMVVGSRCALFAGKSAEHSQICQHARASTELTRSTLGWIGPKKADTLAKWYYPCIMWSETLDGASGVANHN